jgi:hypothetical protein
VSQNDRGTQLSTDHSDAERVRIVIGKRFECINKGRSNRFVFLTSVMLTGQTFRSSQDMTSYRNKHATGLYLFTGYSLNFEQYKEQPRS